MKDRKQKQNSFVMYLQGSEVLHDAPEDHFMPETVQVVRSNSWYQGLRAMADVARDSMLAVFLIVVFSFALTLVEGAIEANQASQPVNPTASSATAHVPSWHNLLGIKTVHAASLKGYETEVVEVPSSMSMAPGERLHVKVHFKNIGEKSWSNDGPGYISAYTFDPKYRRSVFDPGSWLGPTQVKRIQQTSVSPGQVATMEFELHAPEATGVYTETFHLAAEDTAWIPGGQFSITVDVTDAPATATGDSPHAGKVVAKSSNSVTVKGGASVLYTAILQNTGSTTWGARTLKPRDVQIASGSSDTFVHPGWESDSVVSHLHTAVPPGGKDYVSFAFLAPDRVGSYTAQFQVSIGGHVIEGAEITIPVEVTSGSPAAVSAPVRDDIDGVTVNILEKEPMIRVGVLIVDEETDDELVIVSEDSDMQLVDTNGNILANVDRGDKATTYYKNGKYYFDVGRGVESSTYGIRFVPETENGVLRIDNFDRRETRNAAHADNRFRNVIEIRYNDYKDRTWAINELPMSYYLAGSGETSEYSHPEFQKALMIASRTYAYYHWTRNTKRVEEHFHVSAYSEDQVYMGASRADRNPSVGEAVRDTAGIVVTYDGELAITPYFSRSDGRTRDWSEVWYGTVEWLIGVPVPCDVGKTLWGHGVGMSAQGALCMAEQGDDYQTILNHFYTGIDLEKRWETQ